LVGEDLYWYYLGYGVEVSCVGYFDGEVEDWVVPVVDSYDVVSFGVII